MLTKMRVFVKVADTGSFSDAGKQLNMAPSSVSRSISNLEHEIGATLILRNTRNITLTAQGNAFYEGAKHLLKEADQLFLATRSEGTAPAGELRVSIFESFGRLHVCDWIGEFCTTYPDVHLDLELENSVVDMLNEGVDLAVRIGKPADSNLRFRRLLSNNVVLCAAPDYIAKYGAPNSPEELQEHNCLTLKTRRQRTYWYFTVEGIQQQSVLVSGNLTSSGGTPLLAAARAGAGLVLLADWMVLDAVKKGELVLLLENWQASLYPKSSGDIYAIYPNQSYVKPALRQFLDFMVEKISAKGFS